MYIPKIEDHLSHSERFHETRVQRLPHTFQRCIKTYHNNDEQGGIR